MQINSKQIGRKRIKLFLERMDSFDLDLCIIYSDGKYFFTEIDPFYYLTGFKPMGKNSVLFLSKDDEPTVLITPYWDLERAKMLSWIDKVSSMYDFFKEFNNIITKKNWGNANRVGIIGTNKLTKPVIELIGSSFKSKIISSDQIINQISKIPDELEVTLAKKASEIAKLGYQYLLKTVKPGLREFELAAEIYCYMKGLGADDNFQLISASQHNLSVNPPSDRRLDIGDIILAEISPSYRGKFVQICRTAVIGNPSKVLYDKYEILINAMREGMKSGLPGIKAKEITKSINDSITSAGYGKYCFPPYMRVRGHGLGLGSTHPGQLTLENETELEEGMMFIVHPNQYIPETGYLLCGETVMVTKNGLEPLTRKNLMLDVISV